MTPAREADQQEACQKCRRHGDSVHRSVGPISVRGMMRERIIESGEIDRLRELSKSVKEFSGQLPQQMEENDLRASQA